MAFDFRIRKNHPKENVMGFGPAPRAKNTFTKNQIKKLKDKLLIQAEGNKVAVCPRCNEWFKTTAERNEHKQFNPKCGKKRK